MVKLLSTNKEGFPSEEHESIDNIANLVAAMTEGGIRMEVCLYATKSLGILPESILPGIEGVGNGWLSLIGYQAKNYLLLTIF